MGKLVRTISADGSVMACAIDATDIVGEIERIHKTSAVVSAALGRLSAAASMMGCMLKAEGQSVTLRMKGGGPIGSMIAVADSFGNVKCYAENNIVELPLNQYGKLDVSGAVGKDGFLQVIKDLGLKEPYTGQVPIVSGEIAEDITQYFAASEPVSYTHLDVYKRQGHCRRCPLGHRFYSDASPCGTVRGKRGHFRGLCLVWQGFDCFQYLFYAAKQLSKLFSYSGKAAGGTADLGSGRRQQYYF